MINDMIVTGETLRKEAVSLFFYAKKTLYAKVKTSQRVTYVRTFIKDTCRKYNIFVFGRFR